MKVLVTGAAGFIGRMVMAELATRARLTVDGAEREVEAILALDLDAAAMADLEAADPRVRALGGGLTDAGAAAAIEAASPGLVIHLAAVVSGAAEADFDLGVSVNLLGTLELLNLCRRFAAPPVLLFSSSVAVFSCPDNDSIDDDRMPAPRSSYGAQKLMGEILVRDASRKGFVLGRALRFPTISVRPGKPNKAASSFASGILREPLAGEPAVLPVGPGLRLHLASPEAALAAVFHAAGLEQGALEGETTLTLPGVSVSVAEMVATLDRLAGAEVAARIRPAPDPAIEAIVASWPGEIRCPRARALGFEADADFDALLRRHMARIGWGAEA